MPGSPFARNPLSLAVYTFSPTRYMFPVLPELTIVSIPLTGDTGEVVSAKLLGGRSHPTSLQDG